MKTEDLNFWVPRPQFSLGEKFSSSNLVNFSIQLSCLFIVFLVSFRRFWAVLGWFLWTSYAPTKYLNWTSLFQTKWGVNHYPLIIGSVYTEIFVFLAFFERFLAFFVGRRPAQIDYQGFSWSAPVNWLKKVGLPNSLRCWPLPHCPTGLSLLLRYKYLRKF